MWSVSSVSCHSSYGSGGQRLSGICDKSAAYRRKTITRTTRATATTTHVIGLIDANQTPAE
jgi:hypothetical protein